MAEGTPQGFEAVQGGQSVMVQVHVVRWAPQHRQPLTALHLQQGESKQQITAMSSSPSSFRVSQPSRYPIYPSIG